MSAFAKELLALIEFSTPRPWKDRLSVHGSDFKYVQIGEDEAYTTLEMYSADAEIIVHLANHAEAIADLCETVSLYVNKINAQADHPLRVALGKLEGL